MKIATTILTCLLVFSATAQTVTLVQDINPGSASAEVKEAVALNGKLYFNALKGTKRDLWRMDGPTSAPVLGMSHSNSKGADPGGMRLTNGHIIFKARWSGSGGEQIVRALPDNSINPNPLEYTNNTNLNPVLTSVRIGDMGTQGPFVLFSSNTFNGGHELCAWAYTSASNSASLHWGFLGNISGGLGSIAAGAIPSWYGPGLVRDINPNGDSDPRGFATLNGKTYFTADNGTQGREIWVTDGTPTGTSMVKDISPGTASSNIGSFVPFAKKLFFVANDGIKGNELWMTDGTTAGTVMVRDINMQRDPMTPIALGITKGSNPTGLMVWNNKLYFSADNGTNGAELWQSDGTGAGTVMLKDISAAGSSSPKNFSGYIRQGQDPVTKQIVNQQFLCFTASDGTTGEELWRSDGTAAGTVLLKDVKAGAMGSSPSELRGLNTSTTPGVVSYTHYYYSAVGGNNGRELWEFHPLSNSHKKVSPAVAPNVDPLGEAHNWPWVQLGNALYFYANFDSNGGELWKVTR